jgi:hypothetical protein
MMPISFKKTLKRFLAKNAKARKLKKERSQMGDVIYVDFSQGKTGEMWELHQPINETDYMMAIRCPYENFHGLIARRIEKLNYLGVSYKIFLDGELVHHEEHLNL